MTLNIQTLVVNSIFHENRTTLNKSITYKIEKQFQNVDIPELLIIDMRSIAKTNTVGKIELQKLINEFIALSKNKKSKLDTDKVKLTNREIDVLNLIAKGLTYNEIAKLLYMSIHTVTSHIKKIYRKLSVHSRGEAVFEAIQLGLIIS